MKNPITTILLILVLFPTIKSIAQNTFYLRANSANFNLEVTTSRGEIEYIGKDRGMKEVFENNKITTFRNAFVNSTRSTLIRTWVVKSDSKTALNDFLTYTPHIFEFGEYVEEPILAALYPNDYGITSPVANLGLAADLDYFDFIGVPDAWEYTPGSSNVRVGISDGGITPEAEDFENQIIQNGVLSNDTDSGNISHGNGVSMTLAGEGNNGKGSTGICQDCEIVFHYFRGETGGLTTYEKLEDLAMNGAQVINCSFYGAFSSTGAECIQHITEVLGSIVVASSGNGQTATLYYPASYDNVISVGAVGSRDDFNFESIVDPVGDSPFYTIKNLKHALGGNVAVNASGGPPPTANNFQDNAYTIGGWAVLNEKVDIVAPGAGVFRYGYYLETGNIDYTHGPNEQSFTTSSAAPMVSGTIALMIDLNSCLNLQQIESILKSSSTYIAEFKFNRDQNFNYPWTLKHGSGTVNTGKAVKLVNDLLDPNEIAYLSDQKFTRWDFEFEGVSQHIEIRNQEFTEASTLSVIAKNGILIEENSLLEPNSDGDVLLDINPSLVIATDCIPPGFTVPNSDNGVDKAKDAADDSRYVLAPTKVSEEMSIYERVAGDNDIVSIHIYDLMNREVFSRKGLSFKDSKEATFNLQALVRGIYIVKGYSANGETVLTEKIIKL